jgi:CRISPR-associated endonuclease/helicase Cas3
LIVVPSRYGGCDKYGWNPESDAWVADVYEEASVAYDGRRFVVRVAPGLIRQALVAEPESGAADEDEGPEARRRRLDAKADRIVASVRTTLDDPGCRARQVAEALADLGLPNRIELRLQRLLHGARKGRFDLPAYPYGGEEGDRPGVVLVAPFGLNGASDPIGYGDVSTEDNASSFIGYAQPLVEHSGEVRDKILGFARAAGISETLADDLALSGWLHDAGKADIRFQRLLHGGDLLGMETKGVLAKSERGRSPPGAWERALLPDRWRHEALSVRLALENPRLQEADDRALVLWLVGTHHGLGRPFFPHSDDWDDKDRELGTAEGLSGARLSPGPGPQSLGFVISEEERFGPRTGHDPGDDDLRGLDWSTLFRDLKRRYGPWGLARLEVVLRLADHRASEAARERAAAK